MKRILAMLAVLLVAGSASGITEIGQFDPKTGGAEVWKYFDFSDAAGTYKLGREALLSSTINFDLGSAFVGTLYACDTQAYAAATCDTVTSLSADVSNLDYTTARRYFILTISTPETGSNVSTLSIKGSLVDVAAGASDCVTVTGFGDGFDTKYEVGAGNDTRPISISFDRDNLGDAETQTLTLQYCSTEVDTSCANFLFDSTGNGIGDTHVLLDNDVAIELGGVRNISGFNYLRVQETGTYVSTASFTICRNRS